MSITTRSILKGYFQTGAVPTQSNFGDFIDSALIPDAEGNVGIGVATPAATLDVAGTVNATAFTGSGAGLTGIPAASLVGALTVPASGVTGELAPAQIPTLDQLRGTLSPAQLPPGGGGSGGGVASIIDFTGGGSISGDARALRLMAPGLMVMQSYGENTPPTVFAPVVDLQYFQQGEMACLLASTTTGTLFSLHVPVVFPVVLNGGVAPRFTLQLQKVTGIDGQPLFSCPPSLSIVGTPLANDPTVVLQQPLVFPVWLPPAQAVTTYYVFDLSALELSVDPDQPYVFVFTVSLSTPARGSIPLLGVSLEGGNLVGCTGCVRPPGVPGPAQVTLAANGVGVGIDAPSCALDVAGIVRCTGLQQTSDARLKTGIAPLGSTLSRLAALQPVTFAWRPEAFPGAAVAGPQLGLVAQQVEAVFPELVAQAASGAKSLDYSRLAAALVGAVRELAQQNTALRDRVAALEQRAGGPDFCSVQPQP